MTDPERLLASSDDATELALLRAAVDDPEHEGRAGRLLAALGIDPLPPGGPDGDGGGSDASGGGEPGGGDLGGQGELPGGDAAPLPGNAGGALGAGAQASIAPAATGFAGAKLGALVLAGAVVGAAAIVAWPEPITRPLERAQPVPSAIFVVEAPAAPTPTPAQTAPPPATADPPTLAPPKRPPRPPAAGSTPSPAPPKPAAAPGLAAEIAALDRARGALRRGDRPAARAALNDYFARFPSGTLAPEARALARKIDKK